MTAPPDPRVCLMCGQYLEVDRPDGVPYCTHCDRGHEHLNPAMCSRCAHSRAWGGHREAK